jgi:predicted porin
LVAAYSRFGQCAQDIAPALAAGAAPSWQREIIVGGAYNFGPATMYTGYYNFNPSEDNKVLDQLTFTNQRVAWLGTKFAVSRVGTIKTQVAYYRRSMAAGDANAKSLGVTYLHALSKRSNLYISGALLNNGDRAAFNLNGATSQQSPEGPGLDPRVISFGMTHVF